MQMSVMLGEKQVGILVLMTITVLFFKRSLLNFAYMLLFALHEMDSLRGMQHFLVLI